MEQAVNRSTVRVIAMVALSVCSGAMSAEAATRIKFASHGKRCTRHSANGTGVSANIAKFQVYEGLLKSTDTNLWAAWMATSATPGYVVKNLKYHCVDGKGLGVGCSGRAKVCKL